jgi:hypothetical protein
MAKKLRAGYPVSPVFPGGNKMTVWRVRDMDDVNAVLGNLRPIAITDLQIVPTPSGTFETWKNHLQRA